MNSVACNYNPLATISDNSCTYAETYYTCLGDCINDSDGDNVCDELEVLGCTDNLALNYNQYATDDDGSCIDAVLGCTDPTAFNYNADANTDDGLCVPVIYGCIDEEACTYSENANTDDGSCEYSLEYYDCSDNVSYTHLTLPTIYSV